MGRSSLNDKAAKNNQKITMFNTQAVVFIEGAFSVKHCLTSKSLILLHGRSPIGVPQFWARMRTHLGLYE